jgi:aerobic carbon-monoxide dehydrogenase medium subunit
VKPAPFAYHAPSTIPQTIELLSLENAKLLAGGQSLVPMLNMRFAVPDHVIDLNRVVGLSGISVKSRAIEIGAMTRQCALEASGALVTAVPIIREALYHTGHVQTRSRGTIGGSLCHLDPAAELPAVCLLLDAELETEGQAGKRTLAAADWFQGFMQPALAPDELLMSIRIEPWQGNHGFGFSEFSRRHGDYAIAGAAAGLAFDGGRKIARAAISVFGVEVSPRRLLEAERLLIGSAASQEAFRAAVAAVASLEAMSDATATAGYRLKIAAVMVRRALEMAHRNAMKGAMS